MGVFCNFNFTINVHSDMVCSGMKNSVILHVGDGAVVKLWRLDPAKIMEKWKL